MLKFQQGEHFDMKKQKVADGLELQHEKIKAFRLVRYKDKLPGLMSIDGERNDSLVI